MAAPVAKLHYLRFNIRLTRILQSGDMDSAEELDKLMKFAWQVKADQVTVLPVNKPSDETRNPSVYNAAMKAALSPDPPSTNCQMKLLLRSERISQLRNGSIM